MDALNLKPVLATVYDAQDIDFAMADVLCRLNNPPPAKDDPLLWVLCVLTSAHIAQGHTCLHLSALAGQQLGEWRCPDLPLLIQRIQQYTVIGQAAAYVPLILTEQSLYLRQYWQAESHLAQLLRARAACTYTLTESVIQYLTQLFEGGDLAQQYAAQLALTHALAVINGGPGTGKTTTVTRILVLLLRQAEELGVQPLIVLAAPTGKAAARLTESITIAKQQLAFEWQAISRQIPDSAQTLHRLLGARTDGQFKHHADAPLTADIVVLDEASMVDLRLMHQLLISLKPSARLILLGDANQLSSVEAGSVLSDLCDLSHLSGNCIPQVMLTYSHRFKREGGIGLLAHALLQGETAHAALDNNAEVNRVSPEWVTTDAITGYANYITALQQGASVQQLALLAQQFKILCTQRHGAYGCEAINTQLIRHLQQLTPSRADWVAGRLIMIRSNDYYLNVFNGDMGIVLPNAQGYPEVWLENAQHQWISLPLMRLPAHDSAFAITVHQSQGSEFDRIMLVLGELPSPYISRELVYTGLTRARSHVSIYASEVAFEQACATPMQRDSGLRRLLINV